MSIDAIFVAVVIQSIIVSTNDNCCFFKQLSPRERGSLHGRERRDRGFTLTPANKAGTFYYFVLHSYVFTLTKLHRVHVRMSTNTTFFVVCFTNEQEHMIEHSICL